MPDSPSIDAAVVNRFCDDSASVFRTSSSLKQVAQRRQTVYDSWLAASRSVNPAAIAEATDHFMGLCLILHFIKNKQPTISACIENATTLDGQQTVRDLAIKLRRRLPSPILQATLELNEWDDSLKIPESVLRMTLDATPPLRMTLNSFGDFHQFCLSNPLIADPTDGLRHGKIRRDRGIHYTPHSLVEYLTRRVFCRLELWHGDESLPIVRVIDPSCGCGAFLLFTYRYLSNAVEIKLRAALSTQNRLDLLNCIFGVDIDGGAVDWARRALLLAAWEGSISTGPVKKDEDGLRIPDIRKTIVAGDFLLSPISAVDAVVGGPPFVRLRQLKKSAPEKLDQYRKLFQTARSGQFDLYMLFFEKAISILRPGGWLGWSVSNTFLRADSGRTVRQVISLQAVCHELVEFETRKIYPDAVTQIALVFLKKDAKPAPCQHIWIRGNSGWQRKLSELLVNNETTDFSVEVTILPPSAFSGNWSLGCLGDAEISHEAHGAGASIGELPIQICSGVVTGNDDVFLVREIRKTTLGATIVRNRTECDFLIESDLLRPIIRSREITAFTTPSPKLLCITPYDPSGLLIAEARLAEFYPKAYRYLQSQRQRLVARLVSSDVRWYAFRSSAALQLPPGPKVMLKRISSRPDYTLCDDGLMVCNGTLILLAPTSKLINPLILLAILNSSIFWTFVRKTMPTMGEGYALRVSRLREFCLPAAFGDQTNDDLCRIQNLVTELLTQLTTSKKLAELIGLLDQAVARLYAVGSSAQDDSIVHERQNVNSVRFSFATESTPNPAEESPSD